MPICIRSKVDSVQKTLGIFDSLLRKDQCWLSQPDTINASGWPQTVHGQEIEERSKEYRRLWDAIDTHTHDLSTQALTERSCGGIESLFSLPIRMKTTHGGK